MPSNNGPESGPSRPEGIPPRNTPERLRALKSELRSSKEVVSGERDVLWDKNYMGKYADDLGWLMRDINKTLVGEEGGSSLEKSVKVKPDGTYTVEYYKDPMGGNDVYILSANLKNGRIKYTIPIMGRREVTTSDMSGKPVATVEKILNP